MKTALALLGLGASTANAEVFFSETFGKGWEDRWVMSEWKKSDGGQGKFELAAGKYFEDEEENKGLMTSEDSKFYGASASFPSFSNEGKTLILQYTVKYEKDLECGGGYLKLGPKMDDQTKFGDPTKYNIMFGPDKCGYNSRTHLIFTYNGKNVLKKTDLPYKQETIGTTVLYQLKLKTDNTVQVLVDGDEIYNGSMETDWELLEPKEIDDPSDTKPEDWVDEEMMDDPEDKKPEDWVETAEIPDPEAKQPDDWDVEEDGEWEAPMKANPDFKGEWSAKRIVNPKYKGEWKAKVIANPEYKADDKLYLFKEFGFIGFDLWQVKSGAIFDNVLLTDDETEAKKFFEKWEVLSKKEKELKKVDDDAEAAANPPPAEEDMGGDEDYDGEGEGDYDGEGDDGEDGPDDEDL